jgi:CRISPR-associated protein Cas2
MWIMVMFDLPVDTPKARKRYREFLKYLKADGFQRLQFSVYARPCPSEENAEVHRTRVQGGLPPDGHVRIFTFTDKQFERHQVYWGRVRSATERSPEQISFF